jgi:hypothetical protein
LITQTHLLSKRCCGSVAIACKPIDSNDFDMDSLDLQALRIDATKDAAYFFSLLSCCSKELGVQDLARIAASSKSLNEACVTIARRDMHQLLGAAVAQAAEAEAKRSAAARWTLMCRAAATARAHDISGFDSDGEAHFDGNYDTYTDDEKVARTAYTLQVHAVEWLLRAAPVEAASEAAVECMLSMPAVPQQAAVQLVEAGMRVSYAQLLRAADRMVKGVEVWVLAQQQLGVQTDIPEDAVDICRGDVSVFERWVRCSYCCFQLCTSPFMFIYSLG